MNEFIKQLMESTGNNSVPEWNLKNMNLFREDSIKKLWVFEFLSSTSSFDVKSCDLKLLGLTRTQSYDEDLLRRKFMNLKCFKWLLDTFEDEIYFGELTVKLQNALIDDPKPYRKDIKSILKILLNWIIELKIDGLIVDRPNYSQRIRKINIV